MIFNPSADNLTVDVAVFASAIARYRPKTEEWLNSPEGLRALQFCHALVEFSEGNRING